MAREVVDLYHGAGAGAGAEAAFDRVHREREPPEEVREVPLDDAWRREDGGTFWPPDLLWRAGLAASKSEARRLIEQGGVRLDGEPLTDPERGFEAEELSGKVLQVGRRRFVRLVPPG
jgi:tyrosyl-tRNA synthetase